MCSSYRPPTLILRPTPLLQALLNGLSELLAWVSYMGPEVCSEVAEAEKALDRVAQAARYIVQVCLWG